MILPKTQGDARAAAAMQRVDEKQMTAAAALGEVDAIEDGDAGAVTFIVRGQLLGDLGRAADAAAVLEKAVALAPESADAHHALALAYADLGRHADALAAWQTATQVDPKHRDAHFNAGQAAYNLGDFAAAHESFQRALALGPDDFVTLRKVIQAEHALGLDSSGTKQRLVATWRASRDPSVRGQTGYVFDQFDAGGWHAMALELLGDPLPADADLMRFVVEDRPGHVAFTIRVETSAYSRERGTPYIVSVSAGSDYQVVDSYRDLPPYEELKGKMRTLLGSIRPGTA